MQSAKIGKKFPWKTWLLGIFCIILIVVLIAIAIPSIGIILLSGAMGFLMTIADGAWLCFTSMTFWMGFGVMGVFFFAYFYRKNYAKHKVLIPTTTSALQGGLIPTNPFAAVSSGTVIVPDKKDEVITSA